MTIGVEFATKSVEIEGKTIKAQVGFPSSSFSALLLFAPSSAQNQSIKFCFSDLGHSRSGKIQSHHIGLLSWRGRSSSGLRYLECHVLRECTSMVERTPGSRGQEHRDHARREQERSQAHAPGPDG